MSESDPRLYVLPPSHYCERARWALDFMGIAYVEKPWAVGLHVLLARRIAPATTLPILAVGGKIIQGSGHILDWTGIPGGIPEFEKRLEVTTAALMRQFLYTGTLSNPDNHIRDMLLAGVPPGQRLLGQMIWPVTRRAMIRQMQLAKNHLPDLRERMEGELNWFEAQLSDEPSLVGGPVGRAAITAASLLSPLARPPSSGPSRLLSLPDNLQELLLSWARKPSLRWVTDIYAQHRKSRFHPISV